MNMRRGKFVIVGIVMMLCGVVCLGRGAWASTENCSAFTGQKLEQCKSYLSSVRNYVGAPASINWMVATYVENYDTTNPKGQYNVCSMWIGNTYNKKSNGAIIDVSSSDIENMSVPAMFYGVCMTKSDTTKMVWVDNDNNSIADDGSKNVTRPVYTTGIGETKTSIDLCKFVNGISPSYSGSKTIFRRTVTVGRQHGTTNSTHQESYVVKLRIDNSNWSKLRNKLNNNCGTSLPEAPPTNPGGDPNPNPGPDPDPGTGSEDAVLRLELFMDGDLQSADEKYVKPGDIMEWAYTYTPGAQKNLNNNFTKYVYYRKGSGDNNSIYAKMDGNTILSRAIEDIKREFREREKTNDFTGYTLGIENKKISEEYGSMLENAFKDNLTGRTYKYNLGDSAQKVESQNKTIGASDVGKTYTIVGATTDKTPKTLTVGSKTKAWGSYTYNQITGVDMSNIVSNSKTVKIPYNFVLAPTVELTSSIVYSGEETKIKSLSLINQERENVKVDGIYSTKTPNNVVAKMDAYICDNDNLLSCSQVGTDTKNAGSIPAYERWTSDNISINVPDTAAGKYFCVAVKAWPASSEVDDKMSFSGGEAWSSPAYSCAKIAKRPSMQVWGAGIYSEKTASNFSLARKNNIIGSGLTYKITGVATTELFGSWGEYSTITKGTLWNFASGAALRGGRMSTGNSVTYCNSLVPLSLANRSASTCPNMNATGNMGNLKTDISLNSLLENYMKVSDSNGTSIAVHTEMNLNDDRYYQLQKDPVSDEMVRYTELAKPADIAAYTVPKDVVHIVRSRYDVTITGNIVYEDINYSSASGIPKMIIATEGSIKISCNVARVDAILIAKGEVDTCSDGGDINSVKRSRQLRINGTIIAKDLKLGRTYGATDGEYGSTIPAEIINYDSTILLWSRYRAESSKTKEMETTYIQELAPRY